mmetsp:Transcript_25218/g.45396  ORF Transcript_25218/g.45396 Transcript_25218/m.45396 type:complete len:81 (+) Transcript_25218:54-296(+)
MSKAKPHRWEEADVVDILHQPQGEVVTLPVEVEAMLIILNTAYNDKIYHAQQLQQIPPITGPSNQSHTMWLILIHATLFL